MSSLASKLAALPTAGADVRRGPVNACFPLYGEGDLDVWQAIEDRRALGETWREVQRNLDALAGVTAPLPLEKFRYHWRRMCYCWPADVRR